MTEAKHLGRFVLDYRLFAEALGLPELARVKVIDDASRYYGGAVIVIEHPDLPEVEEGEQIPEIMPLFEGGKLVDWGWCWRNRK